MMLDWFHWNLNENVLGVYQNVPLFKEEQCNVFFKSDLLLI